MPVGACGRLQTTPEIADRGPLFRHLQAVALVVRDSGGGPRSGRGRPTRPPRDGHLAPSVAPSSHQRTAPQKCPHSPTSPFVWTLPSLLQTTLAPLSILSSHLFCLAPVRTCRHCHRQRVWSAQAPQPPPAVVVPGSAGVTFVHGGGTDGE